MSIFRIKLPTMKIKILLLAAMTFSIFTAPASPAGDGENSGKTTFVQISDTQIGFADTTAHYLMSDCAELAGIIRTWKNPQSSEL